MEKSRQSSISRHEALAPFSRDHHIGLVQARKLVRASGGEAQERCRAIAEFIVAWRTEILVHFQDEERLLLSLMSDADRQRMVAEHRQLVELVTELDGQQRHVSPDRELLAEIGTLLNQHIRWEERDLFNNIQNRIDEDTLAGLQASTTEIEASRDRRGSKSNRGTE